MNELTDFQETYQENDLDFFIHVAEKSYLAWGIMDYRLTS